MEINYFVLWGAFLVALAIALVMTPVSIWLAPKVGAIDIPKDERRMHVKPVPRFGGVAIFAAIMVASAIFVLPEVANGAKIMGILAGGAIIFVGGVIDDLHELKPKVKLLFQFVSATVVYTFGIRLNFIGATLGGTETIPGSVAVYLLTIIWIVGLVNAMNLIDGLDGLAAGIAAISSLCVAYAGYIHGHYIAATAMLAIAGGTLGFLPYNFNPAKTFMGDCGSQFLGYCLATFALVQPVKSATVMAIALPVMVMGIPIFDTAFAILRRLWRRQPIGQGDKEHIHHRVMQSGFGVKRSVLLLYCISGIMGVMAVEYSRDNMVECLGLMAIVILLLYVLLAEPSAKNVRINAVNIKAEEDAEKAKEKKEKAYEERMKKAEAKAAKKSEENSK